MLAKMHMACAGDGKKIGLFGAENLCLVG